MDITKAWCSRFWPNGRRKNRCCNRASGGSGEGRYAGRTETSPVPSLFERNKSFGILHRHHVAGLSLIIEMHLDSTDFEVMQHRLDAPLDRGMVRAVASDEFLDNSPQRRWRQLRMGNAHG